jgi:hypothetical protein
MNRLFARHLACSAVATCTVAIALLPAAARAANPTGTHDAALQSNGAPANEQSDGALSEPYHAHQPPYAGGPQLRPNIAPAAGWYRYGFSGQTHRWGWFGAERYYPRVVWHRGYYGDCCRWAYRQGY